MAKTWREVEDLGVGEEGVVTVDSDHDDSTLIRISTEEITEKQTKCKKLRGSEHAEEEIASKIVSELASEGGDRVAQNERRSKRLLRKFSRVLKGAKSLTR